MGIALVVVGTVLFLIGRSDENGCFSVVSKLPEVRRYVERESLPEFTSLKVGGRISIAVGVVLPAVSAFI
jgi:hypothetical protein